MALPGDVEVKRGKKKNGKFQVGTKAYIERQKRLADIVARMSAGKSFGDLQGG